MGIFLRSLLFIIPLAVQRNIVGPRVREARRRAKPHMSQVDLAAKLQVLGFKIDQSAISKIENGNRPVLDAELAALAKELKVSPSWLLGEPDTSTS